MSSRLPESQPPWSPRSRKHQAGLCFISSDGRPGATRENKLQALTCDYSFLSASPWSFPVLLLLVLLWLMPWAAWDARGDCKPLRETSAGSPKSQPDDSSSGGLRLGQMNLATSSTHSDLWITAPDPHPQTPPETSLLSVSLTSQSGGQG